MKAAGHLFFTCLLLTTMQVQALEVRQTLWGFDGKVVPATFTTLSVLVENPAATPFEGVIKAHATQGLGGRVGAEIVEPVFVAPFTSRWVQFELWNAGATEWEIIWGRGGKERLALDAPERGPPATVLLGGALTARGGLKVFPEELFPTTASATDGLEAVVLDHAPRWEAARREAFLDWVRGGGVVHFAPGADGSLPELEGALAALAGERLGAGRIVRHEQSARELDAKALAAAGWPGAELKSGDAVIHDLDSAILQRLASFTRPDISWTLIYVLTGLYLVAVGPAHLRWSRRRDYRVVLAVFVAGVAVFALLFAYVGRRGHGERTQVRALSLARALGEGRHDVTQWLNAFVTSGDLYTISHAAEVNLYAAPSSQESVPVEILNGREGAARADIPLYSSRGLVHRAVMRGPDTAVRVAEWVKNGDALEKVALEVGEGFPKNATGLWLRHGGRFYPLRLTEGRLERVGDFESAERFFDLDELRLVGDGYPFRTGPEAEAWEKWSLPLIARVTAGDKIFPNWIERTAPQPNLLLIYAPSPAGFAVTGGAFGAESGWTLYVQPVVR